MRRPATAAPASWRRRCRDLCNGLKNISRVHLLPKRAIHRATADRQGLSSAVSSAQIQATLTAGTPKAHSVMLGERERKSKNAKTGHLG